VSQNTLNIGSGKWTGYEPLYLADQVGIFEKNGISVNLISHISEDASVKMLKSGELHGAAITLDMLFVLQESGFPLKAVLVFDYSTGGDMIIGLPGINTLEDLIGKRIGLEKLYINEYFLARSLSEKNIRTSDVEIVIINADEQALALSEGRVDAVVSYNPNATKLLQKGFELIFSSKDIPSSIIDVMVFPKNVYDTNFDDIRKIIQSWFDTLRYINLHYKASMMVMAEGEGVSEYEFKIAYEDISIPNLEENIAFFDLESERNIFKISDITLDFMLKKKMIKNKINTSGIFDSSILKTIR
jgi:NitT/TauT family transport system substrate-binding protein